MIIFNLAKPALKLLIKEVQGAVERENFLKLQEYVSALALRVRDNLKLIETELNTNAGLKFVALDFDIQLGQETNFNWQHGLPYIPEDAVFTHLDDGVSGTVNWTLTDNQFIFVTVTAPTRVKILVGKT